MTWDAKRESAMFFDCLQDTCEHVDWHDCCRCLAAALQRAREPLEAEIVRLQAVLHDADATPLAEVASTMAALRENAEACAIRAQVAEERATELGYALRGIIAVATNHAQRNGVVCLGPVAQREHPSRKRVDAGSTPAGASTLAPAETGGPPPEHVCGPSCVCPVHGTALYYAPAHGTHACQDVDCVHGHGMAPAPQPRVEEPERTRAMREVSKLIDELIRSPERCECGHDAIDHNTSGGCTLLVGDEQCPCTRTLEWVPVTRPAPSKGSV